MKSLFLAGFLAAIAASSAFADASPCVNDPDCVLAGNDYFETTAGTFFSIAGVPVPLSGIPDPANFGADTVVQRLGNIDVPDRPGATETVNTQMLELQLTGIDPNCPVPGVGACRVFVNLDPVDPTRGNLNFTQTVAGEGPIEGTYTSFFDVFFDLTFTTLGGAPLPCDANGDAIGHACEQPDLTLTGSGFWTDDNGPDFIVGGTVQETHPSPPGVHNAQQITPTPEPGTLVLVGLGLVAFSKRRQARG